MRPVLVFSLLSAACLLAGCAKSPQGTVEALYASLDRNDVDAAVELYDPSLVEALGPKLRAGLQEEAMNMERCGGLQRVEVQFTEESKNLRGGKAMLSFKGDCKPRAAPVRLRLIGRAWHLVG